jgi:hypothetical protein
MIFIEPKFGLANRIRVIASGIDLSKETNQDITIVWENSHELNCSFDNLFYPINNLTVINKGKHHFYIKNNSDNFIKNIIPSIINRFFGIDFCVKTLTADSLKRNAEIDIFKIAKNKDNIYIATCDEFGADDTVFTNFKPVEAIQSKIDKITQQFNKSTFGLHIRRTDHMDAIGNSPLNLFTNIIEAEIQNDIDTTFYLSTDDPKTEQQLKGLFGEKIITYDKDFSRNTPQGIKDAVLDMFCLARTTKIYGSFNSSFSNIASRIGQIPLVVLST